MVMEAGSLIPDLTLPDQAGQPRALRQLLGRNGAVIYFYPKDNTPGCTTEAQDFQALAADFAQAGVEVVGISKDSVKSHANFCAKQGLGFTLLSDGDGAACEAFGVWQEKTMYGKTRMGIVRSTFLVDARGQVVRVYPSVKVKGHARQVLNDLPGGS